jgi:hypothetical protein
MLDRVTDLFFPISLNPLCPRVHPCECGCIHEDFLFPIPDGGFNHIQMDGSLVDAWLYFPGLKVGQTFISIFFLFKLFAGVEYQS